MRTVIKNGHIVTHEKIFDASVVIEQGMIIELSESKNIQADKVIDAQGCYILPGGVDFHTKLALDATGNPSSTAFEQNSLAALYGGTTTVIEETTVLANKSVSESFDAYKSLTRKHSYIDYSFHQLFDKAVDAEDIEKAKQMVHNGFPSCCISSFGEQALDDNKILEILKVVSLFGGTSFIHCESAAPISVLQDLHILKNRTKPYALASSHPAWTESEVALRMSNLSRAGGFTLALNPVSTRETVEMLHAQVNEGLPITATTSPHYLLFSERFYQTNLDFDEKTYEYCVLPPLRKDDDMQALWKGIRNGLIHFITSEHCGIHLKHKLKTSKNNVFNMPVGIPGVELRLPLLYTHGVLKDKISINKMVEITATHVTRVAGLRSKGRIEAGTDADIIVFDPLHTKKITKEVLHDTCDYTPYDGMELQGFAKHVFVRGMHMIDNFNFVPQEPNGEMIFRKAVAIR